MVPKIFGLTKNLTLCLVCLLSALLTHGQDSTANQSTSSMVQDDPSTVLSRVEVFNEFQHFQNGEYLNVTTLRNIIALGKRFTTRLEIPIVYNSTSGAGYHQYGVGDISIRLLGYKIMQRKKSAMLASLEFSGNTAQSPLLGSGKNVLSPVVAYSITIPKQKIIMAFTWQEYFSVSGDDNRNDIRWTRFQIYYLQSISAKVWILILPELYLDHDKGGASMNFESFGAYRITNRLAFWIKGGIGLFGDHPARYQWTAETGLRYLYKRKKS